MDELRQLQDRLAGGEPAVLVRISDSRGSAPREVGAWMALGAFGQIGSIGGGRLELEATQQARAALAGAGLPAGPQRHALGPALGQCCGGVVWLSFERLDAAAAEGLAARLSADEQGPRVALFGGGHVGREIAALLARLPCRLLWVDSRDEIFPEPLPGHIRCEHSDPVQAAVAELAPHSSVLIMSFSHAEDLEIVAACLRRARERDDLPFIGLIGSRSKWASFRQRLEARGFSEQDLARVTCPIGLPGIRGKQPGLIALAVVAQLMQRELVGAA